jgi:ABC-type antimicrobial peptide transport system permease subunit
LDVTPSLDRLADFIAVQNSYLASFQSLGALGLLLGTFGLAAVQLRNVVERRGELALLRAAGFRKARLALMVVAENAALLVGGLVLGTATASAAVIPHWAAGSAVVPWRFLGTALAAILVIGLSAGGVAVAAAVGAPLLPALRGK